MFAMDSDPICEREREKKKKREETFQRLLFILLSLLAEQLSARD